MFIVIDGADGVGKSTQAKLIAKFLTDSYNFECVIFSEPSKVTDAGLKLKAAIKSGNRLGPEAEANLFIEDREHDVCCRIKPALASNKVVILDRYYFSTLAYQGARGLSVSELYKKHQGFLLEPDVAFILHCPVKEASNRIKQRGDEDVMESPEYQEVVDKIFRSFNSAHIHHIDTSDDVQEVHIKIRDIIKSYIPR